jgi:tetratricopeptide (TPR) repeat protein
MERFPEAILYLAAAAALGNKQFRSRYLLAKALLAIDEEADAITKLKEAIEIQPTYKAAKELLNGILSTSK